MENRTCLLPPGREPSGPRLVWRDSRMLRGASEAGHGAGTHGQRPRGEGASVRLYASAGQLLRPPPGHVGLTPQPLESACCMRAHCSPFALKGPRCGCSLTEGLTPA